MLVNPSQDPLFTFPGTRMIQESFGIIDYQIADPGISSRLWTIQSLYAPIPGRALGGIRAKLVDQKDFFTFCNQRDLEVLLEIAEPGDWCPWLNSEYLSTTDTGWYGLCLDTEDLTDDLYERELLLRQQYPEFIPESTEIARRLHMDRGADATELVMLLRDMDMDTGAYPDMRIETINRRWLRVERETVLWKRV